MVKEKEKPRRKMWLEFPPWEHVDYKDQTEEYFKTVRRLSNVGLNPKQKSLVVLSQRLTLSRFLALVVKV